MPEHPREQPEELNFEHKKTRFFSNLGLRTRKAMHVHQEQGLLDKTDSKREWGNVTEHCLVEIARVQEFADLLKLPPDIKDDLTMAAAAHDALKKKDLRLIRERVSPWQGMVEADHMTEQALRQAGFSERVIRLVDSIALEPLPKIETMLDKKELSDEEIASLVQHYVDDYTINNEWARPKTIVEGQPAQNDFDRRMDKNEANPNYQALNQEGREHFKGETAYEAQRRVGHLVENFLTRLINERQGLTLEPSDLPEHVDAIIKKKIEGTEL